MLFLSCERGFYQVEWAVDDGESRCRLTRRACLLLSKQRKGMLERGECELFESSFAQGQEFDSRNLRCLGRQWCERRNLCREERVRHGVSDPPKSVLIGGGTKESELNDLEIDFLFGLSNERFLETFSGVDKAAGKTEPML